MERLSTYFTNHSLGDGSSLQARQFPHGHSNLTYLLQSNGERFVLRRPPYGTLVKSAHDMGREVRVLGPLSRVYAAARKTDPLL